MYRGHRFAMAVTDEDLLDEPLDPEEDEDLAEDDVDETDD